MPAGSAVTLWISTSSAVCCSFAAAFVFLASEVCLCWQCFTARQGLLTIPPLDSSNCLIFHFYLQRLWLPLVLLDVNGHKWWKKIAVVVFNIYLPAHAIFSCNVYLAMVMACYKEGEKRDVFFLCH